MATKVKICGLMGAENAQSVLKAGADWIGLNLVSGPRRIGIDLATSIASQVSDVSRCVALVSASNDREFDRLVIELKNAAIQKVQLYGDVTPDTISDLGGAGFETLAVLRARSKQSLRDFSTFLEACGKKRPDYVVIDAYDPDSLGGTGHRANWDMLADAQKHGVMRDWPRMILAGGLTPENVTTAIRMIEPFGVDVSSGVEDSPGQKNIAKVKALVAAVRNQES